MGRMNDYTEKGRMFRPGRGFLRAGILVVMLLLLLMPVEASAARISKRSKTLLKGQSFTLRVKGTSQKAKWSSSKRSVARVNSAGVVKAKKVGKAVITARVGNKKYTCTVTVKQPVNSLKLNKTGIILKKGKSTTIKAKVKPRSASNKQLVWKSSDSKIASVSSKGKVTARKAGSATITARTKDGSKLSASCVVLVQDPKKPMKLSQKTMKLQQGASKALSVSGTSSKIVWSSSDYSVAGVDENGTVTGVGVGKAKIMAMLADGLWIAYCDVTVAAPGPSPSAEALRFLDILAKYSREIQAQKATGHFLGYSNSSSLIKGTWEGVLNDMTTRGIGYTNCAHTVRLALCEMGKITPSQMFWGLNGAIHFGAGVEATLRQSCDILHVEKTVEQLMAEDGLLPGDICTWKGIGHTNVYAGKDANGQALWIDTGRGTGSDGSYVAVKDLKEFNGLTQTLNEDIKNDHNVPDLSKSIYIFNSLNPGGINLGPVKVAYIIRLMR